MPAEFLYELHVAVNEERGEKQRQNDRDMLK